MNWFHQKRTAQPKMDHPITYLDSLARDEAMRLEAPIEFSPLADLSPFLPLYKLVEFYTPIERAAKREYVRRRLANGAKYSDRSEWFWYDPPLGVMAEKLGMKLSDNSLKDEVKS